MNRIIEWGPWSSGYDVAITRRRAYLQIVSGPLMFNRKIKELKQ